MSKSCYKLLFLPSALHLTGASRPLAARGLLDGRLEAASAGKLCVCALQQACRPCSILDCAETMPMQPYRRGGFLIRAETVGFPGVEAFDCGYFCMSAAECALAPQRAKILAQLSAQNTRRTGPQECSGGPAAAHDARGRH